MSFLAAACAGTATEETAIEGTTIPAVDAPEAIPSVDLTSADFQELPLLETIELIDAGAPPHVELRLDLEPGEFELALSQTQTFEQAINGEDLGVDSPQIIESLSTVNVRPDGEFFAIESVVESLEAGQRTSPGIINVLNAALAQSVGSSSVTVIDDRGVPRRVLIQAGDLEMHEILRTLQNVSSPLPAEPVGVGASWENTQEVSLLGFVVEQVTRTTITDIDGNIITMSIEGTQNVPVGTTVVTEVDDTIIARSWDVDIAGTTVIDLGQIVPLESTSTTSTSQVLEINGAVIEQELGLEIVLSGN